MRFLGTSIVPRGSAIVEVRIVYEGAYDEAEAQTAFRRLVAAVASTVPGLPLKTSEQRKPNPDVTWHAMVEVRCSPGCGDRVAHMLVGVYGCLPPMKRGDENPFTGRRQASLF